MNIECIKEDNRRLKYLKRPQFHVKAVDKNVIKKLNLRTAH